MFDFLVRPKVLRAGMLVCLLFCTATSGLSVAREAVSSAPGGVVGELEQTHAEQAIPTGARPGLKKALTSKQPRRADIPDALLVVMLALIGIIVISRRDVGGKGRNRLPRQG